MHDTSAGTVEIRRQDGIAILTRPGANDRITRQMAEAGVAALEEARKDRKDSLPQKVFFDLVYRARLLNASEARSLYLVNEIVPRPPVLERAIELAASTRHANPDIISIGRDPA